MINEALPDSDPANVQRERWDVGVGLSWLIQLRFGALLCGLGTTVVATGILKSTLPLSLLGGAALILLASNLWLWWRERKKKEVSQRLYAAILLSDLSLFTAVLFVTGGASNPFTVIYLVHVVLAAVVLGRPWPWIMAAFSSACFGLLFWADGGSDHGAHNMHGMHGMHGGADALYSSHLQGMWFAFVLTATLIAHFIGKVVKALRARDREIADLKEVAMRNAQLAEMTTMAAGAAHELGSPLSTITVIARELELAAQREGQATWEEDSRLIGKEARRCRDILDRMGAGRGGGLGPELPAPIVLSELLDDLRADYPEAVFPAAAFLAESGLEDLHFKAPPLGLFQVLSTLLSNAFDASEAGQQVLFQVDLRDEHVVFKVEDEGVGMAPDVLRRAVNPFFSTKEAGQGMGLGLFIAWTFAEQSGGQLHLESQLGQGCTAILELPLTQ